MRFAPRFLTVAILALATLAPSQQTAKADVSIDFDRYAAIAYSPKTGKFGYAWNWGSRSQAESQALSECKADDAKVVGWVKGGWLALAVADDNAYATGYEYGDGASSANACQKAIDDCKEQTKSKNPPKIKVVVCSGDYAPKVYKD
jgi:serine/threonine-protein kinase